MDAKNLNDSDGIALDDPKLFINRELSWLKFNFRVLEEAKNPEAPLFERVKFMGIVSSNLDEFFMVRVAGLKQQLLAGVDDRPADGLTPREQLARIADSAHVMVRDQYEIWTRSVRPGLADLGIHVTPIADLDDEQHDDARKIFERDVFAALTPLGVDPSHPFPHLKNMSLNLAVFLVPEGKSKLHKKKKKKGQRDIVFAVVQVPSMLDRLIELPSNKEGERTFVLISDLLGTFAGALFPGHKVVETVAFRVTRNSDLAIDEDESEDLLITIEEELRRRDRGAAVRLELARGASELMVDTLRGALELTDDDVYHIDGPLHFPGVVTQITQAGSGKELRAKPFHPVQPLRFRDATSTFDVIRKRDVLLHHPYESFDPVVRFIEEAAEDPNVLAIKQTLYRTSGDSPIVRALARAAENGKQVAVLVELKARFDEMKNITWARAMEENGVHVIYGVIGLKTHCKVALVVRREGPSIVRYVHIGTGNYNQVTARIYTDLSLFTANPDIAEDASSLFNMITGYSSPPEWRKFIVAPTDLRDRVIELIRAQADRARDGKNSRIVAKMNSLVDPLVIQELYRASQAGVPIELIIRGICCLRAGVPGISENIRVRSIVGEFLEHSRIFVFGAGKKSQVFISSADWMPRNFLRRIEVMAPVEDDLLRKRVLKEIIDTLLRDNVKARAMLSDGDYVHIESSEPPLNAQEALKDAARKANEKVPGQGIYLVDS